MPLRLLLAFIVFSLIACHPNSPEEVPLPTRICIRTQHHNLPIPDATVYIKYHVDTTPGYLQPPAYFDAVFHTDADAQGCLEPVPEGRHWLIAFGYDSLHYPHEVMGSLPVEIMLGTKAVVDTVLYVTEKH